MWHIQMFISCVCVQLFLVLKPFSHWSHLQSHHRRNFGSVLPERELICYVASVTGFASSHPRFPARTVGLRIPRLVYGNLGGTCLTYLHTFAPFCRYLVNTKCQRAMFWHQSQVLCKFRLASTSYCLLCMLEYSCT